jgi:NADP-dependent 3-hydroxy acid dehydrogenase YdfG
MTVDLVDLKHVELVARKAVAIAGASLAAVIHCAGEILPAKLSTTSGGCEMLQRELAVDVQSTATIVKAASAAMAHLRRGTIVLLASTHAYWSNFVGLGAHAAGNAAKIALAASACEELRQYGARVCVVVALGVNSASTDTLQAWNGSLIGAGADLIQPDDIARAVAYCVYARSVVLELHVQPMVPLLFGAKRFVAFNNERAVPARPAHLLDGTRRRNGRCASLCRRRSLHSHYCEQVGGNHHWCQSGHWTCERDAAGSRRLRRRASRTIAWTARGSARACVREH